MHWQEQTHHPPSAATHSGDLTERERVKAKQPVGNSFESPPKSLT